MAATTRVVLRFLPLLLLLPAAGLAGEETERLVDRLMTAPAVALDPALPDEPFGTWLDRVVPRSAGRFFEIDDCGEQTGDPAIDHERLIPTCLAVELDLPSRERGVVLSFGAESLAFRDGAVLSPDLERARNVAALADLPALLVERFPPPPIQCPEGMTRRLAREHAGSFEWCEDLGGVREGPSRSWYQTGLYLMEKGRYRLGEKIGEWTECTRFERCELVTHRGPMVVGLDSVRRDEGLPATVREAFDDDDGRPLRSVTVELGGGPAAEKLVPNELLCGNGGCPWIVFDEESGRVIGRLFASTLEILEESTNGYRDLRARHSVGAGTTETRRYRFGDGAYREENLP